MDYRKYYKKIVGDIPKDYEIHHIDFDRSNNYIYNLVALPKSLHRKYHQVLLWFNDYNWKNMKPDLQLYSKKNINYGYNNFVFIILKEFMDCYLECQKYIEKRNIILGEKYGNI